MARSWTIYNDTNDEAMAPKANQGAQELDAPILRQHYSWIRRWRLQVMVERIMEGSSGHCLVVSSGLSLTFDPEGSLVCTKKNMYGGWGLMVVHCQVFCNG